MKPYFDHEKPNVYDRVPAPRGERVAHASRVLVSASRRNNLIHRAQSHRKLQAQGKSVIARTRSPARETHVLPISSPREQPDSALSFEQEQEQEKE